jgi:hypothetical protein
MIWEASAVWWIVVTQACLHVPTGRIRACRPCGESSSVYQSWRLLLRTSRTTELNPPSTTAHVQYAKEISPTCAHVDNDSDFKCGNHTPNQAATEAVLNILLETEGLVPCWQESCTAPYPEPDESHPYNTHPFCLRLPSGLFLLISCQYPVYITTRPHLCYMPCSSQLLWLGEGCKLSTSLLSTHNHCF